MHIILYCPKCGPPNTATYVHNNSCACAHAHMYTHNTVSVMILCKRYALAYDCYYYYYSIWGIGSGAFCPNRTSDFHLHSQNAYFDHCYYYYYYYQYAGE